MDSDECQQYSQTPTNDSNRIDLTNSQYPLHSSQFQPHPDAFVHSEFRNEFTPRNLQFHRTLPFNPMSPQLHAQAYQQFGSGLSFQGLMSAPNLPSETPTSNSSKGSTRNRKNTENSQATQSTTLRRWTIEEDIALTQARLYVSGDADVGTNQKSETLWNRILKVWREKMGAYDVSRTSNALESRWGTIQSAVNKYHGYYENFDRNPKSGTTPEHVRKAALRAFKDLNDHDFKFEHCWEIMRNNPKWCTDLLTKQSASRKRKSVDDVSLENPTPTPTQHAMAGSAPIVDDGATKPTTPDGVTEQLNPDGVTRPDGRKATKEKKKKIASEKSVADALSSLQCSLDKHLDLGRADLELKKERDKKEYELREQIMKIEVEFKERNHKLKEKAQRRKEQKEILKQDPTNLQPDARKSLEILQAKILKEWNENISEVLDDGAGTQCV